MRIRSFAVHVLISLCGCAPVRGNGQVTSETRDVSGFTQVSSSTVMEIQVASEPDYGITLIGESNILPLIRTRLLGDTLLIESDEQFDATSPLTGRITLPSLSGATNSGSGLMAVSGFTGQGALELRAAGSGELRMVGSAGVLSAWVEGSGDLRLAGSGAHLSATVAGSGSLHAEGFPVAGAQVISSGPGKTAVSVNGDAHFTNTGPGPITAIVNEGTVDCVVSGSGSVSWSGTATPGTTRITGSGTCGHR